MATAEKLAQLLKTKTAIKTAIEEKGGTVGDIPFSQYARVVSSLSSSGDSTSFSMNFSTLEGLDTIGAHNSELGRLEV